MIFTLIFSHPGTPDDQHDPLLTVAMDVLLDCIWLPRTGCSCQADGGTPERPQ